MRENHLTALPSPIEPALVALPAPKDAGNSSVNPRDAAPRMAARGPSTNPAAADLTAAAEASKRNLDSAENRADAAPGEKEPQRQPNPNQSNPDSNTTPGSKPSENFEPEDSRKSPQRLWYQRPRLVTGLIVAGVALILIGVAYWLYARQFEGTDDAFIDGNTAQIASKVAGYVTKLLVDDNQLVHQGDLLIQIDARDYELALAQAKAAVSTAQGRREQAEAQLTSATAQSLAAAADVAAARATAENARTDRERNQKLAPQGAVSQQALDSAVERARSSAAQESAALSRAAAAEAQAKYAVSQLDTAKAELHEARVRVETAELNLSYTRIVAPITGRVTHRTVNLGDYLTPGQALFALVDPNVWVTANFKESQLTNMESGQPVQINIDSYSGRELHGHVDSFQRGTGARFSLLPAENATGNYVKIVQRVPVKILFDQPPPPDMILGPGMSVEPTVTVRPW